VSILDLDLHFDLDTRVNKLELEWRHAFDACVAARAEYDTLANHRAADADEVQRALQCFVKAEELKSHILTKIDRLERRILNRR
jgi:hypothetical protein